MAQQAVGAGEGGLGFIFDPFYDDTVAGWMAENKQPKTVLEDVFGDPNKMLSDFPFGTSNVGIGFGSKILLVALGVFFILMLFRR